MLAARVSIILFIILAVGACQHRSEPAEIVIYFDIDEYESIPEHREIPTGGYHVVEAGETVYRIAQRYNISEERIRELNHIRNNKIMVGQRIYLIDRFPPKPVIKEAKAEKASTPPFTVKRSTEPKPVIHKSSTTGKKKITKQKLVENKHNYQFIWPLKGKITKRYGTGDDRAFHDGIRISSIGNNKVKSAAAGKVSYIGENLKSYGNLVIISHTDGYYTAYGNLKKVETKLHNQVKQGETIGAIGKGNLYFSIRHNKDSVNPIKYLPKSK